jgi:MoaA/NifB/PqqE/SkfB family radical SAM enzyme
MGQLIEFARSLGMSVTLNTNGILVPRYLEILKNVDALAISLDGRVEHHDILRGDGTGEKALEGIRQATSAGIRVHVNMVVNKYNLNDIDYMLELARQHKFKTEFGLSISNLWGDGLPPEEFKPTNEEFEACLRYIIAKKKAGEPVLFSAAAYESVLKCWKDFSVEGVIGGPRPQGMPVCPAGRLFCLVDADGSLWACPHLIGKTSSKNALREGTSEAWRVAQEHHCVGCYQVYHHEFSKLMNLDGQVVWNYVKTALGLN